MHGSGRMNLTRRALLSCVVTLFAGCRREEPDQTPEGAVTEWIDRMGRVHGNPDDARRAYDLLSAQTQRNLEERARRASAATGRKMSPESMIAPSRFSLRFTPLSMKSRVAGERALVEVTGAGAADRAEVPCVRENGRWRVDLVLPPLPEIEMRPDAGS